MIIHSYLTTGFFEWGKLFLKSLKFHHGEYFVVKLDTRDLSDFQIKELYSIYSNLQITNKFINYEKLSEKIGESVDNIINAKKSIEQKERKEKNIEILWKQFISVNDRYRDSLISLIESLDNEILLHFDIDTFFRNNIFPIVEIVESNDVSIVHRPNLKSPRKQIFGTFIGFKINENSKKFVDLWKKEINSVPLLERKNNFGQISLYTVYYKLIKDINWGKIPKKWIDTNKNDNSAILWTAPGIKEKRLNNWKKYLKTL